MESLDIKVDEHTLVASTPNLVGPRTQHLVAVNGAEFAASQQSLLNFFEQEQRAAESQLSDARECLSAAEDAGFDAGRYKRQISAAKRRINFLAKGMLAVDNGYAVMPLVSSDVFAIRTDRKFPPRNQKNHHNAWRSERAPGLPAGDGFYVDAIPSAVNDHRYAGRDGDGNEIWKPYSYSDSWQDIAFPESMDDPRCITAVHQAMDLMIFDSFAVSPDRRNRKDDPLILGLIRHWRASRAPLCFLICWHLDLRSVV